MKNEEKINELLKLSKGQWLQLHQANIYDRPDNTKGCLDAVYYPKLLEMARWKDEKTKQLLIEKTKLLSSSAAQDSVKRCTIEEIYRELFNEEMPNSNPYIK